MTETHNTISSTAESLSQGIMWMTYILPVFALLLIMLLLWKKKWIWAGVLIIVTMFFGYMRFVEKEQIIVKQEFTTFSGSGSELSEIKIALFSDLHLGVYTAPQFLEKVLETVKTQQPDIILIPGDFIYGMPESDLDKAFSPFATVSTPIYAVAGNHDSQAPGSIPSEIVRQKISAYGVQFVDNDRLSLKIQEKEVIILGLSDLWEKKMDTTVLETIAEEQNTILLVHNPDTLHYIESYPIDLVVAGHTHGGQIRIPFLYKKFLPSEYGYERGWYETAGYKMYVTSGIGEVGLPMRFGVPPEVVMIRARIY